MRLSLKYKGLARGWTGRLRELSPAKLAVKHEQVLVTIVSTLLLMVDEYRRLTPMYFLDRLLLYLAVPLVFIIFLQKKSPAAYGFSWGRWRTGLVLTAGGMLLMAPVILYLALEVPAMQAYYQNSRTWWAAGEIFLDLIGWEFFFRGWILFSYAKKYGPDALWLQAVPFALAHIGKPELETLSTIFGGFAFGWIAWRTRSFIYPLAVHWFIATLLTAAASGLLGF